MSFDWREYLDLARRLGAEDAESSKRSAISRAYYAAYNATREYIDQNALPLIFDRDSHIAVWTSVRSGKGSHPRVASRGDQLRKKRKSADYDDSFDGDLQKATTQVLNDAQEIIDTLASKPGS